MFYSGLEATDLANKSALLLVHDRYAAQIAPFVKGKVARLAYVRNDIKRIVEAACEEQGADVEWVTARFDAFLADSIPVLVEDKKVKHEELTNPDPESPYSEFLDSNTPEAHEGIEETDVMDSGDVPGAGLEEALEPDARVDLSTESHCFRCSQPLEKSSSIVCESCTEELKKVGAPLGEEESYGEGESGLADAEDQQPGNPNMPYVCTLCGREGSADEIYAHINQDHADVLKRKDESEDNMGQDNLGVQTPMQSSTKEGRPLWLLKQRGDYTTWPDDVREKTRGLFDQEHPMSGHFNDVEAVINALRAGDTNGALYTANLLANNGNPNNPWAGMNAQDIIDAIAQNARLTSTKEADVPPDPDAAQVEPLPDNPGDRFDDYVQKLAETAAARKFSQLSDEDIHSIASQIGASPDDVKSNIQVVAVFGDQVGVNGQLGADPTPPQGYEEISAQGLSGQQDTHEALVPVDLVIQTVANDMNMTPDLAYNMVKDKYGADLPDKYHASISGQVHYYLPTDLAGNQQPQEQQPQPQQTQQQVGPATQPAPQLQTQ